MVRLLRYNTQYNNGQLLSHASGNRTSLQPYSGLLVLVCVCHGDDFNVTDVLNPTETGALH